MSELGIRISPAFLTPGKLIEPQNAGILEGSNIEFNPGMLMNIIGQNNASIDEIDTKFANLTKNVGLSADAAAVLKTIVDVKGDLIVATAADIVARLPVGTDGQVLESRSTETTGLKWVAVGVGVGSIIAVGYATDNTNTIDVIGADKDILTLSFTTTGKPVLVLGFTNILCQSVSANTVFRTKLKRDTTVLDTKDQQFNNTSGNTLAVTMPVPLIGYETPAAGTYTYKITGNQVSGTATASDYSPTHSIWIAEINL